jgi:hypothetical protein
MRSCVSLITVALALALPAGAAHARPLEEPTGTGGAAQAVRTAPSPVAPADGGAGPFGYIMVGLGGFALGAAACAGVSTARGSRRVLEA